MICLSNDRGKGGQKMIRKKCCGTLFHKTCLFMCMDAMDDETLYMLRSHRVYRWRFTGPCPHCRTCDDDYFIVRFY